VKPLIILLLVALTGCSTFAPAPKATIIDQLVNGGCIIKSYHSITSIKKVDIVCQDLLTGAGQ